MVPGQRRAVKFVHRIVYARQAAIWVGVTADVIDALVVTILAPWIGDGGGPVDRKHAVIIGADWLRRHRAVLDLGRWTMTIRAPATRRGG